MFRRLHVSHQYTIGLLLLTASTGAIDAVSYLALDKVFTGNMTGNVLFIGFALIGVDGIPFLNNVVALLGFVIGSIISGRIVGRGYPIHLPRRAMWTLIASGVIVFGLAGVWLITAELPTWLLLIVTAVLAAVMGAQVSAVKPIGNSDITTIVVTNTLANLARDSRLGGGTGQPWMHRLLAVVAMGAGAALGAWIIVLTGGAAALGAAGIVFALGIAALIVVSERNRVSPA